MTTETTEPVVEAPAAETPPAETVEAKSVERDEQGKFRNPVQPRIDELTRKARENEREAAYWRQRAEAREAQESAKAAPVKPTPDQFTDTAEYLEALADFKAGEKVDKRLSEHEKQLSEKQKADATARTIADRVQKARSAIPDFDAVLSKSDVSLADHVLDAMNDSEQSAEIAYHFAKNPELADRLNRLPKRAVDREIGRLEDKLSAAKTVESEDVKEDPAPVRAKTSAAPPPAKPISSGRTTSVPLEKMNMDDYVKTRTAQGARWAR